MAQGTMPRCCVHGQACPRSGETTVLFPQWVGRFQQDQKPLGGDLGAEPRGRGKEGLGQEQTQVESEANPEDLPEVEAALGGGVGWG